MQFIEDHESSPRRWYGGAVGMIGFDGSMNTGLTLRTAHISGGVAAVRVGATLLFDSDPADEERETALKARALLETLAEAGAPGTGPAIRPGTRPGHLPARHRAGGPARRPSGLVRAHAGRRTSASRAPRSRPCGPGSTRPGWTISRPTWSCCRRGPAARLTSTATSCSARWTSVACRCSACASACRPWSSTRAARSGCLTPRCTASRARSACSAARCWPGCRAEFTAARYHSLHARPEQVSGGFEVTAVTPDGVVMAIEDTEPGGGGFSSTRSRSSPRPAAGPPDHRERAPAVPGAAGPGAPPGGAGQGAPPGGAGRGSAHLMQVAGEVEQHVLRFADRIRLVERAAADPDQLEKAVLPAADQAGAVEFAGHAVDPDVTQEESADRRARGAGVVLADAEQGGERGAVDGAGDALVVLAACLAPVDGDRAARCRPCSRVGRRSGNPAAVSACGQVVKFPVAAGRAVRGGGALVPAAAGRARAAEVTRAAAVASACQTVTTRLRCIGSLPVNSVGCS